MEEEKLENEKLDEEKLEEEKLREELKYEKRIKRMSFWKGMLCGLWCAILVVVLSFAGAKLIQMKAEPAANSELLFDEATTNKIGQLQLMLSTYYYEDIDTEAMRNGLYYGLMESAADPYTCYYSEEEVASLQQQMSGTYQGIGAYLAACEEDSNYVEITGVIAGTPAEASNLKVGDIVLAVDGEEVYGYTSTEVAQLIRGDKGTEVVLTISSEGKESDVTLVREEVETPTVQYELLDNNIAYITITEFSDLTAEQFTEAMTQAKEDQAKGFILDLRGNPGGSLTEVVEVGEQFLPKGIITYTEDKYGNRVDYECKGESETDLPIVVLVDGNTASAAELLAGAIRDDGVGTLIGTTTYGKGIVQTIFSLGDGSAAKITTSKYYTPNGDNIHKVGITPDEELEFDADRYLENQEDNQLERAIELMNEKIN